MALFSGLNSRGFTADPRRDSQESEGSGQRWERACDACPLLRCSPRGLASLRVAARLLPTAPELLCRVLGAAPGTPGMALVSGSCRVQSFEPCSLPWERLLPWGNPFPGELGGPRLPGASLGSARLSSQPGPKASEICGRWKILSTRVLIPALPSRPRGAAGCRGVQLGHCWRGGAAGAGRSWKPLGFQLMAASCSCFEDLH